MSEIQFAILCVLLGLILAAQVIGFFVSDKKTVVHEVVMTELEAKLQQLEKASVHHVDVSAVVKLVSQIDTNPDILERLKDYPKEVRAAAHLHYISILGSALQQAQEDHRKYLEVHGTSTIWSGPYDTDARVKHLRKSLDEAIEAYEQDMQDT